MADEIANNVDNPERESRSKNVTNFLKSQHGGRRSHFDWNSVSQLKTGLYNRSEMAAARALRVSPLGTCSAPPSIEPNENV